MNLKVYIPPTFSIVANASGGRLRCLLELRITLIRSLAQREYKYRGVNSVLGLGVGLALGRKSGQKSCIRFTLVPVLFCFVLTLVHQQQLRTLS